jgi:hypothetical protein
VDWLGQVLRATALHEGLNLEVLRLNVEAEGVK